VVMGKYVVFRNSSPMEGWQILGKDRERAWKEGGEKIEENMISNWKLSVILPTVVDFYIVINILIKQSTQRRNKPRDRLLNCLF